MRIGVFGGSFDPPHAGHLQVARSARQQLQLDSVIWVPAFHPPHKDVPLTDFKHRLGMVNALLAGNPGHEVSEIESRLPQPSYTLHTLLALREGMEEGAAAWYLIIGADNWAIFSSWHQPEAVQAKAQVVVYPRQGIPLVRLPENVTELHSPEIPQESRQHREQLKDAPEKALAELPLPVADYIRRHGLYGISPRFVSP
jgi:nicotinate-nucleotide adenylyltransferase